MEDKDFIPASDRALLDEAKQYVYASQWGEVQDLYRKAVSPRAKWLLKSQYTELYHREEAYCGL